MHTLRHHGWPPWLATLAGHLVGGVIEGGIAEGIAHLREIIKVDIEVCICRVRQKSSELVRWQVKVATVISCWVPRHTIPRSYELSLKRVLKLSEL